MNWKLKDQTAATRSSQQPPIAFCGLDLLKPVSMKLLRTLA
jgi:hypothetical protein